MTTHIVRNRSIRFYVDGLRTRVSNLACAICWSGVSKSLSKGTQRPLRGILSGATAIRRRLSTLFFGTRRSVYGRSREGHEVAADKQGVEPWPGAIGVHGRRYRSRLSSVPTS